MPDTARRGGCRIELSALSSVEQRVVESRADAAGVARVAARRSRRAAARRRRRACPSAACSRRSRSRRCGSALIFSQSSLRPRAVRRVGLLGDDALEAERRHLREERLALALDVVERAHRPRACGTISASSCLRSTSGSGARSSPRTPADRRRRTSPAARPRAGRSRAARQPAAPLQPREARLALGVEHDDLAVEDAVVVRQRLRSRARPRGRPRCSRCRCGEQQRLAAALAREQAIAVELELEDPVRRA